MSSGVCSSAYCNQGWSEVLTHMSPYGYANFGIAFGLGLSVVGAAWGIWLTGSSLVGAAVKSPRIRSKNLIRLVFSRGRRCWLLLPLFIRCVILTLAFFCLIFALFISFGSPYSSGVLLSQNHLIYKKCNFLRGHCYLWCYHGHYPC